MIKWKQTCVRCDEAKRDLLIVFIQEVLLEVMKRRYKMAVGSLCVLLK